MDAEGAEDFACAQIKASTVVKLAGMEGGRMGILKSGWEV